MPNSTQDDDDKDDIPDDFFNDLADSKYLDELLSNQVESREPDSTEQADDLKENASDMDVEEGEREATPDPSTSDKESRRSSPLMERCLKEIDKLTKDIQRKKKKLQKELEGKERENKDRSDSPLVDDKGRRRYRSRSNDRYGNRMHGGRRSTSRRKSRSRSRSRDRRRRSRSRSRQRWINRRSRSPMRRQPVPSPSSLKPLTFLEELDKKFAEQGQAFPEKDLILQMKATGEQLPGTSSVGHRHIGVAQPMPYPPQQQQQQPIEMMQQYPTQHVRPPANLYPPRPMQPDPAYGYQNFMPNPMAFRPPPANYVPIPPPFNIDPTPIPPAAISHVMHSELRPQILTDVNSQFQVGAYFFLRNCTIIKTIILFQINPMAVKARTSKPTDGEFF